MLNIKKRYSRRFQLNIKAFYDGEIVGEYFTDIQVDDKVTSKIKAVRYIQQ
jgi:hypothetical protein